MGVQTLTALAVICLDLNVNQRFSFIFQQLIRLNRMMSVLPAFLLCLILVSANCQIPDGCVDCGLPDRPHCDFGKGTGTCSWCKLSPEEDAAMENFRVQMKFANIGFQNFDLQKIMTAAKFN